MEEVSPASWPRRFFAYLLGIVIPCALFSQLLGTLTVGRSSPEGVWGEVVETLSFAIVVTVTAALTRNRQAPTQRDGHPVRLPTVALLA